MENEVARNSSFSSIGSVYAAYKLLDNKILVTTAAFSALLL